MQALLADPQAIRTAQSAACVLARLLPVVMLVPVFGGAWVPWVWRVAIGMVLAVALTPPVLAGQVVPLAADTFAVAIVGNGVVGLVLGFAASLVFQGAHAAGSLIDLSRGAGLGAVLAPTASADRGPTGPFFALLAVTLFFVIGGHQLLLAVLVDSFRLIPPVAPGAAGLAGIASRETVLALSASVFVLALQLAAPALIVVLLVDVLAGGLHRFALPVNAFFLGLTAKGTLAVGATFLALGVAAVTLRGQFADMLAALRELVGDF